MCWLCDSQPVGYVVEESNVFLRQACGPNLYLITLLVLITHCQKHFTKSYISQNVLQAPIDDSHDSHSFSYVTR